MSEAVMTELPTRLADALAAHNACGFDPKRRWHPKATMEIFDMTSKIME